MTDPAGGTPPPPDQPIAEAPPPAAPPAAAPPAAAPPPAAGAAAWQTPAAMAPAAGPAPGVAYAGLGIRIGALIIDAILMWILFLFVAIALGAIFLGTLINGSGIAALIAGLLLAVANLVISAIYFIWGWTNPAMRASLGQRALGLQTLNATDGATLTRPQAIRRWVFLFGIVAVASAMQSALTGSMNSLAVLIGLAAFAYEIFLLWTTYQSPKKQGYHDVQAGTVVVKRA